MEAQRFPEDYDGILAVAPANYWTHLLASALWDAHATALDPEIGRASCSETVRRAIMFMLVSWFGLTLPLLNAADWFRCIRLLKRLFVSSHLSEVIYVWCYCWRYCFCSCWWRHV